MEILLVDKDTKFAQELIRYIQTLHLSTQIMHMHSMSKAIQQAKKQNFDLLIIDLVLCENDDWIFLDKRLTPGTHIIYLTSCEDSMTLTKAVQTEPLAYLMKPFNKTELHAFLQLVNYKTSHIQEIYKLDNIYSFHMKQMKLYKEEKPVKLSQKEQTLLKNLIQRDGNILSFEEIETLWEYPPKPSTLRTMIYRLREKLEHKFIITVPNEGLKLKREK